MNLSDFRTRLQDFYGSMLTNDDAFYNRIINDSYLELAAMSDWWWLETHEVLRYDAPMATATVDCSAGEYVQNIVSTAIAATDATAYAYGWLYTGSHSYRIGVVTPHSAGIYVTCDTTWIEASGTYALQLWNDALTLNAQCDRPIAMLARKDPNHPPLRHVDLAYIEQYGPDLSYREQEFAHAFAVYREPVYHSTLMVCRIFPPPEETIEYLFRYKAVPSEMANDTASTLIPVKHEKCLTNFSLLRLAKISREDPDLVSFFEAEYNKSLGRMIQDQKRRGEMLTRAKYRDLGEAPRTAFRLINVEAGGV